MRLISNQEVVLDIAEDMLAQYERAPQEGLILLQDHILDKKILDLDDHEVEIVYDVRLAFFKATSCMRPKSTSATIGRCAGWDFASSPNCSPIAAG